MSAESVEPRAHIINVQFDADGTWLICGGYKNIDGRYCHWQVPVCGPQGLSLADGWPSRVWLLLIDHLERRHPVEES